MISSDSDILVPYLNEAGMIGGGFAWLGPDGVTSTYLKGDLEELYGGFVGTQVKMGEVTTTEYIKFVKTWDDMHGKGVSTLPWQGKDNLTVNALTVQVHDAVMAIAQAA